MHAGISLYISTHIEAPLENFLEVIGVRSSTVYLFISIKLFYFIYFNKIKFAALICG